MCKLTCASRLHTPRVPVEEPVPPTHPHQAKILFLLMDLIEACEAWPTVPGNRHGEDCDCQSCYDIDHAVWFLESLEASIGGELLITKAMMKRWALHHQRRYGETPRPASGRGCRLSF